MKTKNKFICFILIIIFIGFIPISLSYAIPKQETALVDPLKVYWAYHKTIKEQKRLSNLRKNMEDNIKPLIVSLKRLQALIHSGSYTRKVKYEYMKEYFLLSSQVQMQVSQYNKQLMTMEKEIRENLLRDVWFAVDFYSKLIKYNYVFKIGMDDVIAYNPNLDITNKIIVFLNTIPNAAELQIQGEALVIRTTKLKQIGKNPISIKAGYSVIVLNDPENLLAIESNGKKIKSNDREYYITVLHDENIGQVLINDITTNTKVEKVNLNLSSNYTAYLSFENYIDIEKTDKAGEYELTLIKVPRIFIELTKNQRGLSLLSCKINPKDLKHAEVLEISDIDKDGIVEIVIYYTKKQNSYFSLVHVFEEKPNLIKSKKVSPQNDIKIYELRLATPTGSRGEVTNTFLLDNGKYYSIENDNTLVFKQIKTNYWIKSNYKNETNPYRKIKPVLAYKKYQYDPKAKKFKEIASDSAQNIQLKFNRTFAPVYKNLGDLDHISEIKKGDSFYIEIAQASNKKEANHSHDLWFRIILAKKFENEVELVEAGFPNNPHDKLYLTYEQDTTTDAIHIKYYAWLHGSYLNLNSLITHFGLPYEIY